MKKIIPIILLVSLLLNIVLVYKFCSKPPKEEVTIDTATVVSTYVPDSAADSSFVGMREYKIPASGIKVAGNGKNRAKIGIKRAEDGNFCAENGNFRTDSGNDVADSISIISDGDSLSISLPITQKVYRDSTYTAYVSGFDARLDSIQVYSKVITVTKRQKPPRFNIGLQAGYGITPKGMQPYIGVGVTWNLFSR